MSNKPLDISDEARANADEDGSLFDHDRSHSGPGLISVSLSSKQTQYKVRVNAKRFD